MNRILNIPYKHSFFLFGARGTGKTWFLQRLFEDSQATFIDLLTPNDFHQLSQHPDLLSERIAKLDVGEQWVIIDEIQKVPQLLDIVHLEIEAHSRSRMGVTQERPKDRQLLFALTGSSARKLKRGQANLLAGRAFLNYLYPFISVELPGNFDWKKVLSWGALPAVITADTDLLRKELLEAYTHVYLREEILEEQIAREARSFRSFLEVAAQSNGQIVNYSAIARDVNLSPNTVQTYFQVLEDTLVTYQVPAYHRSIRKRQKQGPKYYFFDIGVQRALLGTLGQDTSPASYGYGKIFEHFVFLELYRRNAYLRNKYEFSYLMTRDDVEIDLIIERPGMPIALVEIKSSENIRDEHIKSLETLGREIPNSERFCLSRDPVNRIKNGIHVLNWEHGIEELGLGMALTTTAGCERND